MVIEKLNVLKKKLEDQVMKKDSYDKIYETSVEIDKLLIEYYKNNKDKEDVTRKGSNC